MGIVRCQFEMIARRADHQLIADPHSVMNVSGASPASRLALDRDPVAGQRRTGLDQRILPDEFSGQEEVDMGARPAGRAR